MTHWNPNPTRTPRKSRVASMLRTSSDRSDVLRQRSDIDDLKQEYDLDIISELAFEGLSGTETLNNTQVRELLAKMSDPHIDGVALSALDRLFRPKEFGALAILDPFQKQQKRIWSAREGMIEPWTDEGFDQCMNAAARAGSEMREIRRRSMKGKLTNARDRQAMCGGTAAFGYRYAAGKRKGAWVIYEPEAKWVPEIFRLSAIEGKSAYYIAAWLNERGVKTSRGGLWHGTVVNKILRNPCYIGQARYTHGKEQQRRNRKLGIHTAVIECNITVPAILTGEQVAWFNKAQITAIRNKDKRGRPSKEHYLLQSLIYCGVCGKRMTGHRYSRDRRVYHCCNIGRFTHQRICKAPQIQSSILDDSFWNGLLEDAGNPDVVAQRVREFNELQTKTAPAKGHSPAERLAKLKREITNAERILNDAELPDMWEGAKKRKLNAQAEIAVIEREQATAKTVFHDPPRLSIERFSTEVRSAKDWTDHKDKRGLIERMVTRITYSQGEWTAEMRMTCAPEPIESGVQKQSKRIDANVNLATSIPFILKRRIA